MDGDAKIWNGKFMLVTLPLTIIIKDGNSGSGIKKPMTRIISRDRSVPIVSSQSHQEVLILFYFNIINDGNSNALRDIDC